MGFFDSLFGKKEEPIRQIATSQWSGYLASLIAGTIQEAKLDDLKTIAAFVSKVNNGVGLRTGEKGALPDFTDDPNTVAYCYLRDVEMWPKFYETMSKLLVLDFQSAKALADATGEKLETHLGRKLHQTSQFPMIDQFAFAVAMKLEEQIG